MNSVLVLDAHDRHALVAIQCLGDRSLSVTAGSPFRWTASRMSRFVDQYMTYPAPDNDPDGFLREIERELKATDYDMLLPVDEVTVETVARNRSRFDKYTNLPFHSYDRLLIALDKQQTIEAAREADIPHPKTVFRQEMALSKVDEILDYPIVVKSRRGAFRSGVAVCESYTQLARTTQRIEQAYGPVFYQEFIPNGGERGVYTLYDWSGELVGLTVQQRLRSRHPEGGASTYRETVDDPMLVEIADEFLRSLGWQGLAMVEFRIDDRTGQPQLMEINPRLWGSLALSTFAGINFPYLLYQLAVGEDPEPMLDYEVGVRARCLFTDGLQVLQREDTLRALLEFFTPSSKPCRFDVVSRRDPLTILGQLMHWGVLLYNDRCPTPKIVDEETERSTTLSSRK